jgi:hypothetical protein
MLFQHCTDVGEVISDKFLLGLRIVYWRHIRGQASRVGNAVARRGRLQECFINISRHGYGDMTLIIVLF